MFKRLRIIPRFSYANVVASLALFVALGGSAAAGAFVVSSNQQIAPGTIFGSVSPQGANDNIVAGSLGAADLADGSVTNTKIANGSVTPPKLAVPSITGKGAANFGRVTLPVGKSQTLLVIPGLGSVIANCAASDGTLQFHNSSAQDEALFLVVGDFTSVEHVASGATSSPSPGRFISRTTYQVGR